MANPNRALAYLAKRPYEHVAEYRSEWDADDHIERLKEEGWETRKTQRRVNGRRVHGRWSPPRVSYVVWKREKA